jgi:hypothetical protein
MTPTREQGPWVPSVGDRIRPTDGGPYRGVVLEVSPTHVRHGCLATGAESRKSASGFLWRYMRDLSGSEET